MEFLKYSEQEDAATIKLTIRELIEVSTLVDGVLATFLAQDPTILGLTQDRLREISDDVLKISRHVSAAKRGN